MKTKQIKVEKEVLDRLEAKYPNDSWNDKISKLLDKSEELMDAQNMQRIDAGNPKVTQNGFKGDLKGDQRHETIDYEKIENLIKKHKVDSYDLADTIVSQLRRG